VLRTIGKFGRGPGEFGTRRPLLAALSTGDVLLRDDVTGRLLRSQGEELATVAGVLVRGSTRIVADQTGGWYVSVTRQEGQERGSAGWLRFDSLGGARDTVWVPAPLRPGSTVIAYLPATVSTMLANGWIVGGSTETLLVEVYEGRKVRRFSAELPGAVYDPREREQITAIARVEFAEAGVRMPPVPRQKPTWKRIVGLDGTGRIWVELLAQSEEIPTLEAEAPALPPGQGPFLWREPSVLAAFDTSGRFLGSIELPLAVRMGTVRGNQVWGVETGGDGVERVIRWRLSTSP
jgi:hypothetical protein